MIPDCITYAEFNKPVFADLSMRVRSSLDGSNDNKISGQESCR
jgi:hypothetical protein